MRSFTSLVVVALAGFAMAQTINDQIKTQEDQFDGALITPDVIPEYDPEGILSVTFPSAAGTITNGQKVPKDDASSQPTVTFTSTADAFGDIDDALNKTTSKFTMMMIDGDYPGADLSTGVNAHWISNDWSYGTLTNGVLTFTAPSDTQPIIAYAGPGPAAGSGAHRYIVLVFSQPEAYAAPAVPAAGGSVTKITYNEYTDGLGDLLAAVYFTVEVGQSTVAALSTSAVVGATTAASTSGAATGTSRVTTGTGSVTGSAASTTATTTNAAGKMGASFTGLAGVAALVGAVIFA